MKRLALLLLVCPTLAMPLRAQSCPAASYSSAMRRAVWDWFLPPTTQRRVDGGGTQAADQPFGVTGSPSLMFLR